MCSLCIFCSLASWGQHERHFFFICSPFLFYLYSWGTPCVRHVRGAIREARGPYAEAKTRQAELGQARFRVTSFGDEAPKFNWANYNAVDILLLRTQRNFTLSHGTATRSTSRPKTVREAREKGASLKDLDTALPHESLVSSGPCFSSQPEGPIKDVNLDLPFQA